MLLSSFLPLSRWRRLVCALWWLARRLAVALGLARAPPSLCAALSGCRRWCALACAAVVLFCLASRFRSAPQDEAKTMNNYAIRGTAAARPLSAAPAARWVPPAIVRGLSRARLRASPALRPVCRVHRLRSVYTLYHERLFVSCILNTICHYRGLTCIH